MTTIKVLEYINANPNLKMFFRYYVDNSDSLFSKYYNFNFTVSVMHHICQIYEESHKPGYSFVLDEQALYILLLSVIFMNFYSIDSCNDDIEAKAKSIYKMSSVLRSMLNDDLTESIISIVTDNIKAVVYPYQIADEDLNLYQRILRECSFLTLLTNFSIQSMLGFIQSTDELKNTQYTPSSISSFLRYIFNGVKVIKLNYVKDMVMQLMDKDDKILNEINKFCLFITDDIEKE